MRFLRSRSPQARQAAAQAAAVDRFWSWWRKSGAQQTAAAIAEHHPERMAGPLEKHLAPIHPGLTWSLASDPDGGQTLVVSADGDPALRAVASRWRQASPPRDDTWAYSDHRLAVADPDTTVLTLGDTRIDVTSAAVWAGVTGSHVDVLMYHPGFAELPEDQQMATAFLLLDTVLGEAAVDDWLGTVETATEPPPDPLPLVDLRAVVSGLEAEFTDVEGQRAWQLRRGRSETGDPVLASAQVPLRATSAPHLDTYVDVSVCFSEWTPDGLPGKGSLQRLRDLQDELNRRLGRSGRVVAHETRRGVRTLHLYVDGTTFAIKQLRAVISSWTQGTVSVMQRPDPQWDCVRHLRD